MRTDALMTIAAVVFAVTLLGVANCCSKSNYRDCMKIKNDDIICRIYARGR